MRWVLGAGALIVLMLLPSHAAWPHQMPNSAVYLDFGAAEIRAEIVLPTLELQYAFGPITDGSTPALRDQQLRQLERYLARHFEVRASDGRAWSAERPVIRLMRSVEHLDVVATYRLRPPEGASVRRFSVRDDIISHEVKSHVILVFGRSDLPAGRLTSDPVLIGALQYPVDRIAVERPAGVATSSFVPAFFLGMKHISEGIDHLLFLLALLLPAPLAASGCRWRARRSSGAAVKHLALIVSAFTLGHSATLIVGAASGFEVAQAPVELLIAASIIVAALQSWRPVFGHREPLIAFAFGLIHGLSFASVISHYALSSFAQASAILGFNLGIETVQLAIVLTVSPVLVALARTRFYARLRQGCAAVTALAASYWVWTRVRDVETAGDAGADMLMLFALVAGTVAAGLFVNNALLRLRRRGLVSAQPVEQ